MKSVGICHSMESYMASLIDRKKPDDAVRYYESNRSDLERIGGSQASRVIHMAAKAYASLSPSCDATCWAVRAVLRATEK